MAENPIMSQINSSSPMNTLPVSDSKSSQKDIPQSESIEADIKLYLNQNIHRKKYTVSDFSQLERYVQQFAQEKEPKTDIHNLELKYIDSANERVILDDQESFELALSDIAQAEQGKLRKLKIIANLKSSQSSINSFAWNRNNNTSNNSDLSHNDASDLLIGQQQQGISSCLSPSGNSNNTNNCNNNNNNIYDPNYSMFLFWKQFYFQQQHQQEQQENHYLSKSEVSNDSKNEQNIIYNESQIKQQQQKQQFQSNSLPQLLSASNQQTQQLNQSLDTVKSRSQQLQPSQITSEQTKKDISQQQPSSQFIISSLTFNPSEQIISSTTKNLAMFNSSEKSSSYCPEKDSFFQGMMQFPGIASNDLLNPGVMKLPQEKNNENIESLLPRTEQNKNPEAMTFDQLLRHAVGDSLENVQGSKYQVNNVMQETKKEDNIQKNKQETKKINDKQGVAINKDCCFEDSSDELLLERLQVGQSIVRERTQDDSNLAYILQKQKQNQRSLSQLRNDVQSEECVLQLLGQAEKCSFCSKGLVCEFRNKQRMIASIIDQKITEVLFVLRPLIQAQIEKKQLSLISSSVQFVKEAVLEDDNMIKESSAFFQNSIQNNMFINNEKEYSFNEFLDIPAISPFHSQNLGLELSQMLKNKNGQAVTQRNNEIESLPKPQSFFGIEQDRSPMSYYGKMKGYAEESAEVDDIFRENVCIIKDILEKDINIQSISNRNDMAPFESGLLASKDENNQVQTMENEPKSLLSRYGISNSGNSNNLQSLKKNDGGNFLTKSLHSSNSSNLIDTQNTLHTELSQSLGKEKINQEGFLLVDMEELEEGEQPDENGLNKQLDFSKMTNQLKNSQPKQHSNNIQSNFLNPKTKLKNIKEDVVEEEESKEDIQRNPKGSGNDNAWCIRRDKASKEHQYDAEFVQKEIIVEFQLNDPCKDILVEVKNTGMKYWRKGNFKLKCLAGAFENNEFYLPETNVEIGQNITIHVQLFLQQLKLMKYVTQWRLCVIKKRGSDLQFFGPQLQIVFVGVKKLEPSLGNVPIPEIPENFWEKIKVRLGQMINTDQQSKLRIQQFILKQQKKYKQAHPSQLDKLTCQIVNEFFDS